MCVIFCPLDMKGSSKLRNWSSPGQSSNEDPRRCMLMVPCQQWPAPCMRLPITVAAPINLTDVPGGTMAQRRYPPVALIECVADIAQKHHKVRRLHLVIVDLWRPWNQPDPGTVPRALRLQYSADCTTPLSPKPGKTPLHGRRFVYGYSLDGSDFPCCLLWPKRTPTGSFCLLDDGCQGEACSPMANQGGHVSP